MIFVIQILAVVFIVLSALRLSAAKKKTLPFVFLVCSIMVSLLISMSFIAESKQNEAQAQKQNNMSVVQKMKEICDSPGRGGLAKIYWLSTKTNYKENSFSCADGEILYLNKNLVLFK